MTAEIIASQFDRWNDALQSRNPDSVVELYANDAILLPTISNRIRRTPDEIRDYFETFLRRDPRGVVDESTIFEFGDVAVRAGQYTFDLTDDGRTSRVPCRFSFVYRKDGDDWKIIEHHSSAMPEPV